MDVEKINILYVDDEPNNLVSFTANYRRYYNIFTAESAEKGREILNANNIHVLITDQRMPNVSGLQFLESIIREHPFPVRIILTGYSDIETVIEAINKGQVYRYVLKPFDFDELKVIIDNAVDLYFFRRSSHEAMAKYHHLFENANDAIFIMDEQGTFKEMNAVGLSMFKVKDLPLESIDLISLFVNAEEYKKAYAQLVINESIIDLPVKLKSANNELIHALFSASKIKEDGKIVGYQGMIRDITRQKEIENLMIRTIIETQENERIRFGRNLHDGVGSMLATIKVMLQSMALKDEDLKANPQLKRIFDALNSAIIEMRNVCFNIMPVSLQILGLPSSISELCGQYEEATGVHFEVNIPDDFPKLNAHLELAIFRIIQEFVNNSIRHGKATLIRINFWDENGRIFMRLTDNGIGFNIHSYSQGLGIKNIKSRIQSYNGEIAISSSLAIGTEFNITLPVISPKEMTILN
jgi:PAS domain S-box-containing protein